MTKYLFIGGPLHGTMRDVSPFHATIGYLTPQAKVSPALKFVEDTPTTDFASFEVVAYRPKKTFFNIMAVETMSDEEVYNKLKEYKGTVIQQAKNMLEPDPITEKKVQAVLAQFNAMKPNTSTESIVDALSKFVPGLYAAVYVSCPECKVHSEHSVASMVIHLNDNHAWTFDQIADYVDRLPYDLTVKENR